MTHSQVWTRKRDLRLALMATVGIGLFLAGCSWWRHGGKTATQYYPIAVPAVVNYGTPPLNPSTTYLGVKWIAQPGLPVYVCFQAANNPFTVTGPLTIQGGTSQETDFRANVEGTFYFTTAPGTMCPNPSPINSTPHIIIVRHD